MSEHSREVEGVLLVRAEDQETAGDRVAALEAVDRFQLRPRPPQRIRDVYIDTDDGALAGSRVAFRLREQDGRPLLTLKADAVRSGLASERLELEAPWSAEALQAALEELRRRGVELPTPPPEGSGEPRRGAPVDREGSGEPHGGAPVDREGSGEPQGGAPEDRDGRLDLLRRAEQIAVEGRRVVLLAHSARPLDGERPPAGLEPRAMVVIGDQVRGDAADTVAWFAAEGVQVKVVSGDHPRTVGAIAAQVGIGGADQPVDARSLPDGQAALADLLEARSVFGRVVPRQKREMVDALGARGHVVAMTGDGVNDVLALKDADLGIAMGSGSAASRAVAELVLMDGRFATLPAVMAEGRRVIANIERVAKLFVTKTVYATALALAVGMAGLAFPFLPRHLTLISSLTIGIPGFFLALEPNTQRSRPGFVRRTLAFAVPAGLAAALGTLAAYQVADLADVPQDEARTTATLALAGLGLVVLALAARPLNHLRRLLLATMAAAFAVVLLVPFLRAFFALDLPPLPVALTALAVVAAVGGLLTLAVLRRASDPQVTTLRLTMGVPRAPNRRSQRATYISAARALVMSPRSMT